MSSVTPTYRCSICGADLLMVQFKTSLRFRCFSAAPAARFRRCSVSAVPAMPFGRDVMGPQFSWRWSLRSS